MTVVEGNGRTDIITKSGITLYYYPATEVLNMNIDKDDVRVNVSFDAEETKEIINTLKKMQPEVI